MAIKIGKGVGKSITLGNSDYPQGSFRAQYGKGFVTLIPKEKGIINSPTLKFKFTDLQDLTGAALGTTEAVVRPKIAAAIYEADPAPSGG